MDPPQEQSLAGSAIMADGPHSTVPPDKKPQHDKQAMPRPAAASPAAAVAAGPSNDSMQVDSGTASTPALCLSEAMAQFDSRVKGMQDMLTTLLAAAQKERDELQQAKQQLEESKQTFERETQRVLQVFKDNDLVQLNVGGHHFTTTVNTLRGAPNPSLFAAMFSGRHAVVSSGPDGSIFIDRDGRHFADILNYIRTQQLAYPADGTDFKYLLELRAEAEYYGLMGLVNLVDRYPYGVTRVVRGLCRGVEDTWVYEDGPDEIVLTVDKPVQLLGVGLCGSDCGYTADLDVLEVSEDFSEEVASLASISQTFTKSDGNICKLVLLDPVQLQPDRYYMLSARVQGPDSYCCEDCMEVVVAGGVKVSFQCWESPNGTNEQRGQYPELYIRALR